PSRTLEILGARREITPERCSRSMATKAELDAILFILNKEWEDGTSSETVARATVKALDDLRSTTWRPIGPPLKVGEAFKGIISSKTQFIAWIGEENGRDLTWVVAEDSNYGCIA